MLVALMEDHLAVQAVVRASMAQELMEVPLPVWLPGLIPELGAAAVVPSQPVILVVSVGQVVPSSQSHPLNITSAVDKAIRPH
jgi:hypothetical protein